MTDVDYLTDVDYHLTLRNHSKTKSASVEMEHFDEEVEKGVLKK